MRFETENLAETLDNLSQDAARKAKVRRGIRSKSLSLLRDAAKTGVSLESYNPLRLSAVAS